MRREKAWSMVVGYGAIAVVTALVVVVLGLTIAALT